MLDRRPATAILADAAGPALPAYVTAEQARAIINAAVRTRDRLLIETLWQTGGRISEVLQLHPADVLGTAPALLLRNEKQRRRRLRTKTVYVSPDLVAQLRAYATDQRLNAEHYFFHTGDVATPMSRQHAWSLVARASAAAGVEVQRGLRRGAARPLDFRHGAAVHQLLSGVPLTEVQRQLGHARLDTTTIYTRLSDPERLAMSARVRW